MNNKILQDNCEWYAVHAAEDTSLLDALDGCRSRPRSLMQEAQAEFLGLDPGTEPLRGREKRALAWGFVAISLSSPQKQGTADNLQAPFTNIPPCYRCSGDGITPSRLA